MSIKKLFGYFIHPKRLLYKNSYNSEVYIDYLRKKGAIIGENTRFISPEKCDFDIGRADYIKIGNNCCLVQATLIAHDYSWYVYADAFNDILPDAGGNIEIGNNCFIGYEACILKGTTIGNNVIIGARSVVKGNVPSNTVWAGVPAKQICTLEELYKRRFDCRIAEAVNRREHIKTTYHRNPTIEEMGFFAFLFLQRTEKNYLYIQNYDFNGIKNNKRIKELFFSTIPLFESFDDFLNYKKEDSSEN